MPVISEIDLSLCPPKCRNLTNSIFENPPIHRICRIVEYLRNKPDLSPEQKQKIMGNLFPSTPCHTDTHPLFAPIRSYLETVTT